VPVFLLSTVVSPAAESVPLSDELVLETNTPALTVANDSSGFTQDELADKMGVSRQTVIDWESGKRKIKPVYLYMFCGVTGFSEDDILLPIMSTECRQE
jgi:hypothetical protein